MAASSCCTKLFDRNGSQVREYGKGDPYIRDLKHTTGHVAGISTALWLPNDTDRFLTASEDGTLRIWHMGYRQKSEYVVSVKSSVAGSGGRAAVTSAEFSNDILLTGSSDGSIKLWDTKSLTSNSAYPIGNLIKAHDFGEKISSLAFSTKNLNNFASRCTDGTVKLWDKRNLSVPVNVYKDLPTIHGETSVIFAHDKILTGTTAGLSVLDLNDTEIRRNILKVSASVTLAWNEKTEQILIGSADGKIEVLFDSEMGNGKGVLLMKQSASASRFDGEVDISSGEIYNSSGTGLFDKSASSRAPSKRKLDKIRSDPVKTHRPELPSYGPGQGGKIGSNVTQTIMKSVLKDTSRDVDPRAALLSYAEKAAKNPKFVTTAYQETQPFSILDPSLLDKEVAIEEEKKRKLEEVERLKAEKEKINIRFK
jgi:WD repeat-containing protein 70